LIVKTLKKFKRGSQTPFAENNNSNFNSFYWMLVVKIAFNFGCLRNPFPWTFSSSKSNCQTSVASTIMGCFKKCKEIIVQLWFDSSSVLSTKLLSMLQKQSCATKITLGRLAHIFLQIGRVINIAPRHIYLFGTTIQISNQQTHTYSKSSIYTLHPKTTFKLLSVGHRKSEPNCTMNGLSSQPQESQPTPVRTTTITSLRELINFLPSLAKTDLVEVLFRYN
jgi:hypothetical protein